MKRVFLVVPLLATGVGASESRPTNPQYYFDCDAAAAHESSWTRTVSAQIFQVTGTVSVLEAREDPDWLPALSLHVRGDGESQRAGLLISRERSAPSALTVYLLADSNLTGKVKVGVVQKATTPLRFTMEVSASNQVKLSFGTVIATTHVTQFPIKRISLGCSTGEFEFDQISVREAAVLSPNKSLERTRER